MFAIRVLVSLALIVWTLDLIRQSLEMGQLRMVVSAASGYPIWILAITGALLALNLLVNLLPVARRGTDTLRERLPEFASDRWRLVAFMVLWVGYVAMLPRAGFLVATATASACSVLLLDRKARWWVVVPGAIAFALVVEIVFRSVFFVLLPGSAVDEWVDQLIYRL